MSGLRSIVVLALRRPRLSGARSSCAGGERRIDLLDQLDLRALEVAVQLLEIGLVDVDLGHRRGDLGERQDTHLVPLEEQALDFFEFL